MAGKGGYMKGGGRPKGSPNIATQAIRDKFRKFVEHNFETIQDDFDKLTSPKDRLYYLVNIAEYVLPKLQRTEIASDPDQPLEVSMSDEELTFHIKRILNGSNGQPKKKAV